MSGTGGPDAPGSLRRGAPIGGGFGLRLVLRRGFFCRIRDNFCPCFLMECETGPFIVLRVGTGPEICRFRRLWTAKLRTDRTIACPIEKKACFGGRVSSDGGGVPGPVAVGGTEAAEVGAGGVRPARRGVAGGIGPARSGYGLRTAGFSVHRTFSVAL